jgi:hypothetical protein
MSNKTQRRVGTYHGTKRKAKNVIMEVTMKRKIGGVVILLLALSLISCAAQKPIPDTARVVQLTVPNCE